jgi:hypothetical protein
MALAPLSLTEGVSRISVFVQIAYQIIRRDLWSNDCVTDSVGDQINLFTHLASRFINVSFNLSLFLIHHSFRPFSDPRGGRACRVRLKDGRHMLTQGSIQSAAMGAL